LLKQQSVDICILVNFRKVDLEDVETTDCHTS
jgi:hypothetical protein